MHADAHFVIGSAHMTGGKPCQDYATSGTTGRDGAYAIVSDGCSSGGRTDIGSRIVALATAAAICDPWTTGNLIPPAVSTQQLSVMAGAQSLLGCSKNDLLATAVYAVATPEELFAIVQGDGVVAWKTHDGTLHMTSFEWDKNTPYYPAYANGSLADFIAHHGGDVNADKLTSETWIIKPDESAVKENMNRYSLSEGIRGIFWPLELLDTTVVAVFSDGVLQVDKTQWQDSVYQLMNFKTNSGEFAKRRLNRFVKNSHLFGQGPIDDLAYAVIILAPEEE
jgi:hypothetical protein